MTIKVGILRNATIKTATVTVYTNHGDIVIDLFDNHAPNTVDNFIGLVEGTKEYKRQNTSGTESDPPYDEAIFHRIVAGSTIRGDDPLGTGTGGPGYMLDSETHPELQFGCPYLPAMANAGRHDGHDTSGSQPFIIAVPTPHLNGAHTISGGIADDASKKVVDEIARVVTDHWGRLLEPATIISIDIEEQSVSFYAF